MSEEKIKFLKEKLASTCGSVGQVYGIFLLLNITILFSLVGSSNQLKNLEEKEQELLVITEQPWEDLQPLYDLTFGPLNQYYEKISLPWFQMSLVNSLTWLKIQICLPEEMASNPVFEETLEYNYYCTQVLKEYNGAINEVRAAQAQGKGFFELNRRTLISLTNSYLLENTVDVDSFNIGQGKVDSTAKIVIFLLDSVLHGSECVGSLAPRMRKKLEYAYLNHQFTDLSTEMLFIDLDATGSGRITDSILLELRKVLEDQQFGTLQEVYSELKTVKEGIKKIKEGSAIPIPLVDLKLSYLQFAVFGGIVNLFLLLYLLHFLVRIRFIYGQLNIFNGEIDSYEIKLNTWPWFFSRQSKWIAIPLNSLYFTSIALIGIFVGSEIVDLDYVSISVVLAIALFTLTMAIYTSFRLWSAKTV